MLQSVKQLLKAQSDVAMYLHDDTETIKRLKDRGTANDVVCLLVVPNTACSCPSCEEHVTNIRAVSCCASTLSTFSTQCMLKLKHVKHKHKLALSSHPHKHVVHCGYRV